MGRKWGRHSKGRPEAPPRPDDDSSLITEHSWWLDEVDHTTTINRRWRNPRPDGLHPRRRATDQPLASSASVGAFVEHTEPFDPEMLYEQMSPVDACGAPSAGDTVSDTWTSLGLSSEASWTEIVARQRELAKEHHPDRHAGDVEQAREAAARMAEINAAVTELSKVYRVTGER